MKSLTRCILVLLVLSAVTLFAPSIYASCMFTVLEIQNGQEVAVGFCSCGSSYGPYCQNFDGTDRPNPLGDFGLLLGCEIMCPGVPYQTKIITIPSTPMPMFKYPRSYELAQVKLNELKRVRQMGDASGFGRTTLYELVLR